MSWGWALLHLVWQGSLVGAASAIALARVRPRHPEVRYGIACLAMAVMLALPVLTAWRLSQCPPLAAVGGSGKDEPLRVALASGEAGRADLPSLLRGAAAVRQSTAQRLESALPRLVALWYAGVAFLALRLLGSWGWMRRRVRARSHPAPDRLRHAGRRLAELLRLRRRVDFLESDAVQGPMALGSWRPVVLVPAGGLQDLSSDQLDAILAHELAHVARHDYVLNLLQSCAEALLFYHPATWWISRRIRQEREHCCDDLAARVSGGSTTLAKALVRLEHLRLDDDDTWLALAGSRGSLLGRVERLLSGPTHEPKRPRAWLPGVLVAATVSTALVVTPTWSRQALAVEDFTSVGDQDSARAANSLIATLHGRSWELHTVKPDLERIEASGSIHPLIAGLHHPDLRTRAKLAWALGNLRDPRAVEPLIEALRDPSAEVESTAAWALGMIGERAAVDALILNLDAGDAEARQAAAWGLGKIADPKAVDRLLLRLEDPAADVRHASAWALGRIGDRRASLPLASRVARERDSDVRQQIARSLSTLE